MPQANNQDGLHLLLIDSEIWHAGPLFCKNCAVDTMIINNSAEQYFKSVSIENLQITQGLYYTWAYFSRRFWAAGLFFILLI